MTDWIAFWDSAPAVFASARHKRVHYVRVADDLARFLPSPDARVLDFGCGEALAAPRLAERCGCLVLCEGAPGVRRFLAARYADHPKIEVTSPEEVAAMPEGSFSLITVNSVLQYLSRAQIKRHLLEWRRLLRKGGSLVLSDVIDPRAGRGRDTEALLGFALKEGFFLQALYFLLCSPLSPYRRRCAELGLTAYGEEEILALLEEARLPATRVRPNVGHNQARMAFQAFRLR